MSTTVTFYVEDVDTQLLSFTSIRLYRDTTPNSTFSTLVTTITLVAGQTQYSYTDASGTASSWYRTKFYNTGSTAASGFSPPWQSSSFTLRNLRYEAARLAHAASAGTCSATGTSTTLIDAALLDSGKDTFYHAGDYLYRPDAASSVNYVRRCIEEPFDTTTGALSIASGHPWTDTPASDEAYQLFQMFPPISLGGESLSWDDEVRKALRRLWVKDQVDLGVGTSTGKTRYSITAVAPFVHKLRITRVWLRRFDDDDQPIDELFGKGGSYWMAIDNGADGIYIDLSSPPSTEEHVIVDCTRVYPPLYSDTDVVAGSDGAFDYAVAAVARQALITSRQQDRPIFADVEAQYVGLMQTYGAKGGGVYQ